MGYDIEQFPEEYQQQIKSKVDTKRGSTNGRRSSGRNDFEHELQMQAMKYIRLQYPSWNRKLFAIPNGGARNAITGKKLKDEGVLAGVWDLFLAIPKGRWAGCFIETKWGRNTLSASQKKFREANKAHYYFFVYRSLDEFIEELEQYLNH